MTPTIFDLANGPVNLATDWPDYADAIGTYPVFAFLQNTGDSRVYVSAQTNEPGTDDTGHVLGPRESFDVTLPENGTPPTWVWAPTGAGRFAISER